MSAGVSTPTLADSLTAATAAVVAASEAFQALEGRVALREARAVLAAGGTPGILGAAGAAGDDLAELAEAISSGISVGQFGGTANDLTCSIAGNVVFPALRPMMEFWGTPAATNTGPVTIAQAGFSTLPGKLALKTRLGKDLAAGDLVQGRPFRYRFDGTQFVFSGSAASESAAGTGTFTVIMDQTFDGSVPSAVLTIPAGVKWLRIKVLMPGSATTGQSVALRASLDGSTFLTGYTLVSQGTASQTAGTTTTAMGIACTVDNTLAGEGFDETMLYAGSASQYSHAFTRYYGVNANGGAGGGAVDIGLTWCRTNTIGLAKAIQFVGGGYYGNANGNNLPAGTRIIVEALN